MDAYIEGFKYGTKAFTERVYTRQVHKYPDTGNPNPRLGATISAYNSAKLWVRVAGVRILVDLTSTY